MSRFAQVRDKDIKELVRIAERQGWQLGQRGTNHPYIEKDGQKVFMPGTPSDRRGLANLRSVFRRYGIDLAA